MSAAKKHEKTDQSKVFTSEKALSLIIDASLSKHQYNVLRSSAKEIIYIYIWHEHPKSGKA